MAKWRRFDASTPAVVERRRPARPGSLESDLLVPLGQAAVSGVLVAGLAGGVAAWAGASRPLLTAVLAGGVVLCATWAVAMLDRRELLWQVERMIHTDLDRDGTVGRPPVTTVEVVDPRNRQIRYVDVPLSDGQLEELARAVLRSGAVFSRRSLPEGLVNAEVYGDLVARLLPAGLLVQRGRGLEAGVELTAAGRSWLRRYL